MGCGNSAPAVDDRTKAIDAELKALAKKRQKDQKLLLLGPGDAGKSTISKQMKILHLNGFTDAELEAWRTVIFTNIFQIASTLVEGCTDLEIPIPPEHAKLCQKLAEVDPHEVLTPAWRDDIKKLWELPFIRNVYERRSQLNLPSCTAYMMSNLDRYGQPDFRPTLVDVLRCRVVTTGVHEIEFDLAGLHYRIVDVGGQRSERKKWAYCFEDATAMLFVVAMDGYDMKLVEDAFTNRIAEARQLFSDIINTRWFAKTPIVLFLNKSDLFREKISKVDLSVCFDDYKGGLDYQAAADFMEHKFRQLDAHPQERKLYTHVTCATDTDSIRVVFDAVRATLMDQAVDEIGM